MEVQGKGRGGSGDLWDERMQALEGVFGKADEGVLHHIMGDAADVVSFSKYRGVKLYVTAALIGSGQKPNSCGEYELAIAPTGDERWGAGFLPQVAAFSMGEGFDHGHTLDISAFTPPGSTIVAMLFQRLGKFKVLGRPANVLCMTGITQEELDYTSANGCDELLEKMPMNYIVTDLNRPTFVKSWFGRLWDKLHG